MSIFTGCVIAVWVIVLLLLTAAVATTDEGGSYEPHPRVTFRFAEAAGTLSLLVMFMPHVAWHDSRWPALLSTCGFITFAVSLIACVVIHGDKQRLRQ